VIIGAESYRPIVDIYRKPCVVAGFEPVQMLRGILRLVQLIVRGQVALENVYHVAVTNNGNEVALRWIGEVFEPAPTVWRAMGTIAESGLDLRGRYRRFDALAHFGLSMGSDYDPPGCCCGEVIQGKLEPVECPLFAKSCTPVKPIGPCMVSSEGTCAAWYKYNHIGTQRASTLRNRVLA
jgi:hydrogenase expression/formation protein HypD